MNTKQTWTLEVQEDPRTGDAILEFPQEVLKAAGWQEGDILNWKDNGDGSWTLEKVTSTKSE